MIRQLTMHCFDCQEASYVFTVSSQVCVLTVATHLVSVFTMPTLFTSAASVPRTSSHCVYGLSAGVWDVIDDVDVCVCVGVRDVIDDVDVKLKLLFQGSVAQEYDY
jgi:hypothetical protein